MNTISRAVLLVVFLGLPLLSSSFVFAQEGVAADSVNRTGCFTNMRYYDDTGDVGGLEFFIVYSTDGYYVLVQFAEGGPESPVLVKTTIKRDQISFLLPTQEADKPEKFTGRFTRMGLSGKFEHGYFADPISQRSDFKLKRAKSYWQQ